MNKKFLFAIPAIALVLLLVSCSTFDTLLGKVGFSTESGDFRTATRNHDAAANRMAKFGETDAEVLSLYAQAVDAYKKCITYDNSNTGKAYHYLGRILFTGPHSIRNYEESLVYLYEARDIHEKEKNRDFLPVCYKEIGAVLYIMGDFTSAFENYKAAAALSTAYAGDEALMYWLGLGTEQDLPKAMEKYRVACQAGSDLWANIYALEYHINEIKKGRYYSEPIDLFLASLHSKGMDEAKSVWMALLTRSADLGCPPAQTDLWVTYRDNNEAAKGMPYLQKALAADFVPAYFHMGYVYHVGVGSTKVDYNEAKKWYEKAAVEGYPLAQSNLGALYYNNQITAAQGLTNQGLSYYWWDISGKQGYAPAKYNATLVPSYQPPMSQLEAALKIMNSVLTVMNDSLEVYNTLNKSRMVSYIPPNNTLQSQQSSSSSSSGSSQSSSSSASRDTGQLCPSCSGTKKCDYHGFGLAFCQGGKLDCSTCGGDGKYDGKVCTTCKGAKQVQCGICRGTGICQRCKGSGRI